MVKKKHESYHRVLFELISGVLLVNSTYQLNSAGVVNWVSSLSGIFGLTLFVLATMDYLTIRKD